MAVSSGVVRDLPFPAADFLTQSPVLPCAWDEGEGAGTGMVRILQREYSPESGGVELQK